MTITLMDVSNTSPVTVLQQAVKINEIANTVNIMGAGGNLVSNTYAQVTFAKYGATQTISGAWTFTAIPTMNNVVLRLANGTASLPSLSRASDTNNGIYFPGTDAIGFAHNGVQYMVSNTSGVFNKGINFYVGHGLTTANATLEVGTGRSGSGFSRIDLVSDTTYTDAGLRIQRGNTGANSNTAFVHRGTGEFQINAFDAAGSIGFYGASTRRLQMDTGGHFAIGSGNPEAGTALYITKTMSANATSYGFRATPTLSSTITEWNGFYSGFATQATPYVIQNIYNFRARGAELVGGGSSMVNQYGFYVGTNLTNASNNFAYYGGLTHANKRWNIYMAGTARNYLEGNTGIGTITGLGTYKLAVGGDINFTGNLYKNGSLFQSGVLLNANNQFTKAQRVTVATLADAPTITPDFTASNYFYLNLKGNRTIDNPSSMAAGQTGVIEIKQANTGSKTLSWGSQWKFPSNTAPILTATVGRSDLVSYFVSNGTFIFAQLKNDFY